MFTSAGSGASHFQLMLLLGRLDTRHQRASNLLCSAHKVRREDVREEWRAARHGIHSSVARNKDKNSDKINSKIFASKSWILKGESPPYWVGTMPDTWSSLAQANRWTFWSGVASSLMRSSAASSSESTMCNSTCWKAWSPLAEEANNKDIKPGR